MESNNNNVPKNLYQYRSISNTTLENLINNKMWLRHPSAFNDPFDSRYIYKPVTLNDWKKVRPNDAEPEKEYQQFNEFCERSLEDIFSKFFITCFSNSTAEDRDILMWSHYANAHKGICIKYSVSKLIQPAELNPSTMPFLDETLKNPQEAMLEMKPVTYEKDPSLEYYPTRYADTSKSTEEEKEKIKDAIIALLNTKSNIWEYEQEYRIVYHPTESELSDKTYLPGKVIDFPVDMLDIVGITFGYKCSDANKEAIMEIIKNKWPYAEFRKCTQDFSNCKLKSENL